MVEWKCTTISSPAHQTMKLKHKRQASTLSRTLNSSQAAPLLTTYRSPWMLMRLWETWKRHYSALQWTTMLLQTNLVSLWSKNYTNLPGIMKKLTANWRNQARLWHKSCTTSLYRSFRIKMPTIEIPYTPSLSRIPPIYAWNLLSMRIIISPLKSPYLTKCMWSSWEEIVAQHTWALQT